MLDFQLTRDDYFPSPPEKKDYGIGIIGCGGVVRGAHLVAYQKCGYRVLACADLQEENAREAAEKFEIPQFSTRLEDVLNHPEVEIVDLGVHATQRLEIIRKIVSHPRRPRAILSQKPFAMNYHEAVEMVELCEAAGIILMINQQARWAPAHRALKFVVDSGRLGHIYSVFFLRRSFQDIPGSWYVQLKDFNIVDHGIHWFDLSRYFTGHNPLRVQATATMIPDQVAVSPLIFSINLQYAPPAQLMTALHFNNIVQVAGQMGGAEWFIDGTQGSAIVSQTELRVCFKEERDRKLVFPIEGQWFPDAFGGSMGELMQALTENREPQTSGRDNLNSVKIAYAAVQSSEQGTTVEL